MTQSFNFYKGKLNPIYNSIKNGIKNSNEVAVEEWDNITSNYKIKFNSDSDYDVSTEVVIASEIKDKNYRITMPVVYPFDDLAQIGNVGKPSYVANINSRFNDTSDYQFDLLYVNAQSRTNILDYFSSSIYKVVTNQTKNVANGYFYNNYINNSENETVQQLFNRYPESDYYLLGTRGNGESSCIFPSVFNTSSGSRELNQTRDLYFTVNCTKIECATGEIQRDRKLYIPITSYLRNFGYFDNLGNNMSLTYFNEFDWGDYEKPFVFYPQILSNPDTAQTFVLIHKESLAYYMNLLGFPWATSDMNTNRPTDQVIADNPLYDPEPPISSIGQPDNEAGGGDGTGDNIEDNFELPTPQINPASAAVNQYVLNSNQVNSFLDELFNSSIWTNFQLLNKNPKESVVSLTAWPINLLNWDLTHVGTSQTIQCGNVTMEFASGLPIQNGYNKVIDIGEYEIKPYFGSFMDYLTKIEIFLPFVGWRNLSTQNVMGRTIKVKYVLNFEDGGIVVYITSTDGNIERLEQVEQAKLAFDLPIFTSNINEKEKDKLQLLMTAAISAVTAGVGAFGSGAGGVATAAGTAAGKEVVSGASKIAAWQDHINGGSVVSSNATWYLPNKCILKFTRPRKSEPSGYGKVNGYPANYTAKLGDVTGYTEVDNPIINGIECTEIERQKIKTLLQGGIYL